MNVRARVALTLVLVAAASCAPRFDPRLVDVPIVPGRPWVSRESLKHPLVGKIWSTVDRQLVDEAELDRALQRADFVVLGETHDNADHHLIQARLLRAIVAAPRRPALGFEMLTQDQQAAVDAAIARAPHDPDAVASAVKWSESRWPAFELYRPIFALGLDAGLPVVAANLSRGEAKKIVAQGREALDPDLAVRLAREEPIPPAVQAALRAEMSESHCGELPESLLDPLVLAQRARDARMAERIVSTGKERGAVLITGAGHARTDRAVPAIVRKDLPRANVVSVAFMEVEDGKTDPAAYREGEAGAAPYDFLVFTPRVDRGDPCEGMKAHMEKRRAEEKEGKPAAGMEPSGASTAAPAR